MFQDVLLETTPAEGRRRRLTLGITLLGEALVVAVLVAVPLLYLDALPGLSLRPPSTPMSLSEAPHVGHEAVSHPPGAAHPLGNSPVAIARVFSPHPLLAYGPARVNQVGDSGGTMGPDSVCCGDAGVIPLVPGGTYVPPVLKHSVSGPKLISHLDEGMILKRVDPVYPAPAKLAGVQGEVTMRATIGTNGQLEDLQVLNGHPLLIRAAIAAVRQWRFKPYVLNGSPIEVQSQITVRFVLQR